jgi:2,4-dienoyl-CoA reductase-like NADH-dependent reductase (Old Yellow Enzyme family)
MTGSFPNLFSPLRIRGVEIRNRIFSTGHGTFLAEDEAPGDAMIAYHEARARGGAGLIITEATVVHESAAYSDGILQVRNDDSGPGLRRLTDAVHRHDCRIFGQLFHPGREVLHTTDGTAPVPYSASATANERFHIMPREMPVSLVTEVIEAYGAGAGRMINAGYDGVEVIASQGYLPAQFLSPRVNRRTDDYGGSFENRMRLLREIGDAVRAALPDDRVAGLRISGDEIGPEGLRPDETLEIIEALGADGVFDYVNVIAGSSATLGGSVHIVPPMNIDPGYVAPFAQAVKERVDMPVFVAGRINQPQKAEAIIASGQADMCGMTRAMIADPEMANKAAAGRTDDIRACIACNQACIGHILEGFGLSCLQYPETGRELEYGVRTPAAQARKVLVAGGGPAGMKAAAVAAERGHDVTLYEGAARLGGQVLLAELLPGRAEFGGLVTNLAREMELAGVRVVLNTTVDRALVEAEAPDVVIVATGATVNRPPIEGAEEAHVVDSWSVIRDEANVGADVVIADWRCDWIGLGLAEKLATAGSRVRLAVNGYMPGQTIQQYVRDRWLGDLHKLGVEIIPLARLYGVDSDTAYFQHTTSGEAIICEGMETLVYSLGHESVDSLGDALADWSGETRMIGDAMVARTAEEAVFEGLKAGVAV